MTWGIESGAVNSRVGSFYIFNRFFSHSHSCNCKPGSLQQFSWADGEGLFDDIYLCVALVYGKFSWKRDVIQGITYAIKFRNVWPDSFLFTIKVVNCVLGPGFYLIFIGKLKGRHYFPRWASPHMLRIEDSSNREMVAPMRVVGRSSMEFLCHFWISKSSSELVSQRSILGSHPFIDYSEDQLGLLEKNFCWNRWEVIFVLVLLFNWIIMFALFIW